MQVKRLRPIVVRPAPGRPNQGLMTLAHEVKRVALGRAGIRALKREGDGGTPLGRFPVRELMYRPDRMFRPRTALRMRAIMGRDGWCEDPADRNYNRLVRLSPRSTADRLQRSDHLYDLVLVLGYNDRPRVRGKGSAIFVHLARPDYAPTAGCVALSKRDLLALLRQLRPGSPIVVTR